jgi:agmatinase
MATLGGMLGADGPAATFLGVPRDGAPGTEAARIVFLGADCATPYASAGAYCAGAPSVLRAASAAAGAGLGHWNFDLGGPVFPDGPGSAADAGDVPTDPADPAGNRARIAAAVTGVLARGAVPVLVGGDDSVQIPMLSAFAGRPRPVAVLQIDAHIDWRDDVQGERHGLSSTMRRAAEMAHVGPIVQAGARGMGSARAAEVAAARERGVTLVPARELLHGDGRARALAAIPEGAEVVVCLDLDALDPAVMPAVMARTAGGLGHWDVLALVEGAAARGRIAGLGMVEFMPAADLGGQGATAAVQLLAALVGVIARQG